MPLINTRVGPILKPYDARGIIAQWLGFQRAVLNALPSAGKFALGPTLTLAKRYCPKDTKALVNSGYLEITSRGAGGTVEIGFGKGGVPHYALIVHEMLEYKHKAPTRAKFLQIAMQETRHSILARIAAQMRV